jgi:hypothetical protein
VVLICIFHSFQLLNAQVETPGLKKAANTESGVTIVDDRPDEWGILFPKKQGDERIDTPARSANFGVSRTALWCEVRRMQPGLGWDLSPPWNGFHQSRERSERPGCLLKEDELQAESAEGISTDCS